MTLRKLLMLGAAAVVILAVALLLNPRSSTNHNEPAPLYPELKDQIDQITAIRIFKAGDVPAVELTRQQTQWSVGERDGYAADTAKVRKLLLALTQAKTTEEKTSNPEQYATLGVEDTKDAKATGVRVELAGGAQPVNLIVGKAGSGMNSRYVRRAGEPQSWLINQSLDAPANPQDWLRTSVIDVAADRVQSASVTIGAAKTYEALKKSRADADFAIEGLPKGKELSSAGAANGFASALTALTLNDVRSVQDFAADKPAAQAVFRTFDGLVANATGWVKDDKHYVEFKTSYDEAQAKRFHVESAPAKDAGDAKAADDKAAKPADAAASGEAKDAGKDAAPAEPKVEDTAKTLNASLMGWVYEIPEYKYEAIFKPLDGLLKKK